MKNKIFVSDKKFSGPKKIVILPGAREKVIWK